MPKRKPVATLHLTEEIDAKEEAQEFARKTRSVDVTSSVPRRKNPPSTAFKHGNKHAIRKGEVRNPFGRSGKPKPTDRLLSKALTARLNERIPRAVAAACGISEFSSWAQALAATLTLHAVLKGDTSAANLILQATEGSRTRLELEAAMGDGPREIVVVFESSNGDGRPIRSTNIEDLMEQPALPAPVPPTIDAATPVIEVDDEVEEQTTIEPEPVPVASATAKPKPKPKRTVTTSDRFTAAIAKLTGQDQPSNFRPVGSCFRP